MKKTFYLMSLLLALVVSGMVLVSCDDEGEDGTNSDVFSQAKGYWKMDNNPIDKYGDYEWIPFMEITDKYLFYKNYGGSIGEKYIIDKFDTKTNTIVCTYINLEDGTEDYNKWYVQILSVNKEKLYVRFYEEGDDEDEFDTATYTRMN